MNSLKIIKYSKKKRGICQDFFKSASKDNSYLRIDFEKKIWRNFIYFKDFEGNWSFRTEVFRQFF